MLRPQLLSRYKEGTKIVTEKMEQFTMDTMSQLYLFWKIITFFAQTMLVCNGLLLFLFFVLISNRIITNSWHKPKLLGGSQCKFKTPYNLRTITISHNQTTLQQMTPPTCKRNVKKAFCPKICGSDYNWSLK